MPNNEFPLTLFPNFLPCALYAEIKGVSWTTPTMIFTLFIWSLYMILWLPRWLPWWLNGKESACRSGRLNPWVGKISWRRVWQPTWVFLPGEFHGQRNLVGYSPWDHKELEATEPIWHTHSRHLKFPDQNIYSSSLFLINWHITYKIF